MASNVTYRTASNQQLKMDVYYRRGVTTPQPTLVYMHGGFWVAGAKETAILGLVPWMEMGWNVVNVEYRPWGHRRFNLRLLQWSTVSAPPIRRWKRRRLQHRREPYRGYG